MDSTDVHRLWAERDGAYSPDYYAHYGPNDTSDAVRNVLADTLPRSASVLEVGCSAGRHLAHLHDHGFENLTGIDLNPDAVDVMADRYPDLAADATVHVDAIENAVPGFDDDQFDAVYSVETLQHLHPDTTWVFAELARVTGDVLVTVENESKAVDDADPEDPPTVEHVDGDVPLYYRDWHRVFTDLGLRQTAVESRGRDIMRVFSTSGD